MNSRRNFIRLSTGIMGGSLFGCGGGDSSFSISSSSGTFSGTSVNNTLVFKGIPYAQAPVGALRFKSPKPFVPASNAVVQATSFGAASLQTISPSVSWIYPTPATQSEDCLSLNIWAPQGAVGAPVVVWLHGGAWRTGASSMALMDGQKLSEQGLVVVTLNYRLGSLGCLAHPDFTDPDTGFFANWNLQDQAAALSWVKDNIARFGGNPNNVCVAGQSAGATNAILLAQHPVWSKLLHKVVLLSPAGIAAPSGFNLADAAAYTELVAQRLNTTPKGLLNVPAAALHAAELAQNAQALPTSFSSGFAVKASPIQDGLTILSDWTRTSWSARIPVLMSNTLTEGSFFVNAYDPITKTQLTAALPQTNEALLAAVTPLAGSPGNASAVIAAYSQAAMADGRSSSPGNLYIEIYGDRLLRNFSVRYSDALAAQGANVRYMTYMHSVLSPGEGVPHCAELPMLFSTYALDYYRTKVGAGAAEDQLARHWTSAVATFAKNTAVVFADGSAWPLYASNTKSSVQMGAGSSATLTVGSVPKSSQLSVWDSLLGY